MIAGKMLAIPINSNNELNIEKIISANIFFFILELNIFLKKKQFFTNEFCTVIKLFTLTVN
jgi:hypothetical protein